MADSFVRVAPDSTGKMLRANSKVIGANTVYEQYVLLAGMPTYYFQSAPSAAVGPVNHLDIFNAAGSGLILKVRKLFLQQHYATATGVVATFDIHRTSTVGTGGTTLTGRSADTADAALPAQVTARSVPTGGSTSVFSYMTLPLSGEETDVGSRSIWGINVLAEGNETKDVVLREGEGLRVTKTTGVVTTSGNWSVLAVVTTE